MRQRIKCKQKPNSYNFNSVGTKLSPSRMQDSGSGQIGAPKGSEYGGGLSGGTDSTDRGVKEGERGSAFSLSMSVPFLHGQHIDVRLQGNNSDNNNNDNDNNDNNNNNNNNNSNNNNNNNDNNDNNKTGGESSSKYIKINNNLSNIKGLDKSKPTNHEIDKMKDQDTVEKILIDNLNSAIIALGTTPDGWNINNNNNNNQDNQNYSRIYNNYHNNHDDNNDNNDNNNNNHWRSNKSHQVLSAFQPLFYSNINLDRETFINGSSEVSPYLMMKTVRVPPLSNNPGYPISKHSTGQNHPTKNYPTQNHTTQNHPTQNYPTQNHPTQNHPTQNCCIQFARICKF